MIRFVCPTCGRRLKADDYLAGKVAPCPTCKTRCAIPSAAPPADDEPDDDLIVYAAKATRDLGVNSAKGTGRAVSHAARGAITAVRWVIGRLPRRRPAEPPPIPRAEPVVPPPPPQIVYVQSAAPPRKETGAGGVIVAIAVLALLGFLWYAFRDPAGERRNGNLREAVVAAKPVDEPAVDEQPARADAAQEPIKPAPREWHPIRTPLEIGSARITIVSAEIGKVPLEDTIGDGGGESVEEYLALKLSVTNTSSTRKLDMLGFNRDYSFGDDVAELADNFENRYRRIGFGFSSRPKGQVQYESIYPGKSIDDVVVFQLPVDNFEFLRVALPARNVGEEGTFKFQIERADVRRR